jgi:hypothetical protein
MKRYLLPVLCLLFCCNSAEAQRDADKDEQLRDIFHRIAAADGYHYRVSVSTVARDTQKLAPAVTENYQSREQFLIWSSSAEALFFVCPNGQFRVDHINKAIFYKQYNGDQELAEARNAYDAATSGLLDSFFLKGAVVDRKTTVKGKLNYRLSYPHHDMLRSLNLVYIPGDSFIRSLSYILERPLNAKAARIGLRQVVTMDHYKKEMPAEVRRLLSQAGDLEQFLKGAYTGYSLQKI